MNLRPTSLHLCPMSNGLMLSFSPADRQALWLASDNSCESVPSPHQVHSIAFLQQHLVGEVKVLIQNFLFHRVLHVGEVKI